MQPWLRMAGMGKTWHLLWLATQRKCLLRKGPWGHRSALFQPGPNREDALLAKGTRCGSSPCLRVIVVLGPSWQCREHKQEEFWSWARVGSGHSADLGHPAKGKSSHSQHARVPQHPQGYQEKRLVHKENASGVCVIKERELSANRSKDCSTRKPHPGVDWLRAGTKTGMWCGSAVPDWHFKRDPDAREENRGYSVTLDKC